MRPVKRRTWNWSLDLEVSTDEWYWRGFRAGAVTALVALILLALGYLVLA